MITITTKKNLIALGIFCLVFLILGIPFTHWWFYGADDFHALFLAYQTKTWKQLLHFFYEGNVLQGQTGPTNQLILQKRCSFFSVYYRPLCLILYSLQYWLFKTNAYCYFLINVGLHALNTALLFYLFNRFIPIILSLSAILFFAFHPQIAFRFGSIVNEQYYLNATLLILLILLLIKYLESHRKKYLSLSLFLYVCSLLLREAALILPIFISLFVFFFSTNPSIASKLSFTFRKTIFYWVTQICYLIVRAFLYPLTLSQSKSHNFFQNIPKKIPEFKVFLYDFFSLSWLPWNQRTLRGFILIVLLGILILLFIKSKKKTLIFLLMLTGIGMLWPILLGPYNPRYFYEAYGFILLAQFLLIDEFSYKRKQLSYIIHFSLFLCILMYASFCYANFRAKETKMHTIKQATLKLVKNPRLKERALCFVGHPCDGFADQCAQIFWVLFDNPSLRVYFDRTTGWTQSDSNLVIPKKYYITMAQHYTTNYVEIIPIKNGFRYISSNPQKINFGQLQDNGCSLGEKIIHQRAMINRELVVTDFSLIIDQQYLKNNPIFIRWDYEKKDWTIFDEDLIKETVFAS